NLATLPPISSRDSGSTKAVVAFLTLITASKMLGYRWDSRALIHFAARLSAGSELIRAIIVDASVLFSKRHHLRVSGWNQMGFPQLLEREQWRPWRKKR